MAQFRALIHGSRGPASRLGTKQSNMYVTVQSWEGQVNIVMWHNPTTSEDRVRITLGPHGRAIDSDAMVVCLYEGPVGLRKRSCDGWQGKLGMRAQRIYNDVTTGVNTHETRALGRFPGGL